MKILILGDRARYETYMPSLPFLRQQEMVFLNKETAPAQIAASAPNAQILFVDAITPVTGELIEQLPALKMIHSEGVGYEGIDLAAAARRGIFVCNNRGCNAGAVAEQAILLMLALLRGGVVGDRAVREGRQMAVKERAMADGLLEMSECTVGLYGFGDIAKATAARLAPFGCEVYYTSRTRRPTEEEELYHATYLPKEELLARCDILSLHCAVNDQTRGLADAAFFAAMKSGSYLVNTARGDLVDNQALKDAILSGHLAGAGLDVLSPEPVPADHLLTHLPEPYCNRLVFSPHLGGITAASFRRAHLHMWRNAERVVDGHRPDNIVNGL